MVLGFLSASLFVNPLQAVLGLSAHASLDPLVRSRRHRHPSPPPPLSPPHCDVGSFGSPRAGSRRPSSCRCLGRCCASWSSRRRRRTACVSSSWTRRDPSLRTHTRMRTRTSAREPVASTPTTMLRRSSRTSSLLRPEAVVGASEREKAVERTRLTWSSLRSCLLPQRRAQTSAARTTHSAGWSRRTDPAGPRPMWRFRSKGLSRAQPWRGRAQAPSNPRPGRSRQARRPSPRPRLRPLRRPTRRRGCGEEGRRRGRSGRASWARSWFLR